MRERGHSLTIPQMSQHFVATGFSAFTVNSSDNKLFKTYQLSYVSCINAPA